MECGSGRPVSGRPPPESASWEGSPGTLACRFFFFLFPSMVVFPGAGGSLAAGAHLLRPAEGALKGGRTGTGGEPGPREVIQKKMSKYRSSPRGEEFFGGGTPVE